MKDVKFIMLATSLVVVVILLNGLFAAVLSAGAGMAVGFLLAFIAGVEIFVVVVACRALANLK